MEQRVTVAGTRGGADAAEMPENARLCPSENAMGRGLQRCDSLNPRQAKAIELLVLGTPLRRICEILRIDPKTLYRWRNRDADFVAELDRRRQLAWDAAADRMRSLLEPAVQVLAEQLEDPFDATRFRAASTILRLSNVRAAVAVEEP